MTQLYDLSRIREEIKGDIGPFVELFKSAKAEKMGVQNVIKFLKVTKNSLPTVEYNISKPQRRCKFARIQKSFPINF